MGWSFLLFFCCVGIPSVVGEELRQKQNPKSEMTNYSKNDFPLKFILREAAGW